MTQFYLSGFPEENRFILKWWNGGRWVGGWLPKKESLLSGYLLGTFSIVDHLNTHRSCAHYSNINFWLLMKKYQMEWSLNHLRRSPGPLSCESMISLLLRCILYLFTINLEIIYYNNNLSPLQISIIIWIPL